MRLPDQIKSRLFSLLNRGVKYDLSRMFEAAALCGDPHRSYRSIHVAGTNGKGSTCAFIESILRRAGYKTGLYTSPHIVNFEERFKVGNVNVDESDWLDVYDAREKIINDLGLTFFEAATLMAFEIFRRAGAEYAVFETGMGGRLDATNIITPDVSVITKLALDHREYLGDDIVTIAGEKLGIVKPDVPLVMLEPDDQRIKKLAADKCAAVNSELSFVNTNDVRDISYHDNGISFEYLSNKYDTTLHGVHQIQNALLAMAAVNKIIGVDHQTIYAGLKSASIPGRFQITSVNNRTVVFDVAHNPDAARVLVDTLTAKFPNRRILFVVGMMRDKDIGGTINILSELAVSIDFAELDTARSADYNTLRQASIGKFAGKINCHPSVPAALAAALKNAGVDDVICVTGSFYTVAGVSPVPKKIIYL